MLSAFLAKEIMCREVKFMKRIISLLLAVLSLAFLCMGCGNSTTSSSSSSSSSSVNAADTSWDKVKSSGKFILGLDDQFPPMGYVDESTGEIVGFDVDLAKEVCSRLGVELKLQPIVWESKELELDSGNIDCIWNGFTYTEERAAQMNLSVPYMKNTQVIMVSESSKYESRADLKGKTVAVQSGSSGENAVNGSEDFKNSLKSVVGQENYINALMELDNGTVDAVVLDEKVATNYMKKNEGKYRLIQANGNNDYLTEEEYVIGFRKNDEALKNKIIDTLKEMAADGKLAEISTKWFGEDVTTLK